MMLSILRKIKHILFFSVLKVKRKYRVLIGKPTIHVFGDSHSLLFENYFFFIHHVGPATAFKLSSKISSTQGNKKINNIFRKLSQDKQHIMLFSFGEIDCRLHINKASKSSGISLSIVISNTIKSYGIFLNELKKKYPH